LILSTWEGIATNNGNIKQKYVISPSTTRTLVALLSQEVDLEGSLHAWKFFCFSRSVWPIHMIAKLGVTVTDISLKIPQDDKTEESVL